MQTHAAILILLGLKFLIPLLQCQGGQILIEGDIQNHIFIDYFWEK